MHIPGPRPRPSDSEPLSVGPSNLDFYKPCRGFWCSLKFEKQVGGGGGWGGVGFKSLLWHLLAYDSERVPSCNQASISSSASWDIRRACLELLGVQFTNTPTVLRIGPRNTPQILTSIHGSYVKPLPTANHDIYFLQTIHWITMFFIYHLKIKIHGPSLLMNWSLGLLQ